MPLQVFFKLGSGVKCTIMHCFHRQTSQTSSLGGGTPSWSPPSRGRPIRHISKRICMSPTFPYRLSAAVVYTGLFLFSGVTRVGDTRGINWGCHPSIFSWETWRPFSCSSLSISLSLFIAFTRVSPLHDVTHTFFTCPTSFLHYSL